MGPQTMTRSSRRRGWGLTEVMLTLAAVGMSMAIMVPLIEQRVQDARDNSTANHLKTVQAAAENYVRSNYGTLVTTTSGGAVALTLTDLKNAGVLPQTFPERNAYGHTTAVLVRTDGPDRLLALVVTNGPKQIDDSRGPQIAAMSGANGGFVMRSSPAVVSGAFGGWTEAISNFASGSTSSFLPRAGSLVAQIHMGRGNALEDFLYRTPVPGLPEANQMQTALDMAGNAITNASLIDARDLNVSNAANITGDTTVGGTITAAENITAGQDIQASRDISAGETLLVGDDLLVGQNIVATGDVFSNAINAADTIYAPTVSATTALTADTITTETAAASSVIAGQLDAQSITTQDIDAANMIVTALQAANVTVLGITTMNGAVVMNGGLFANGGISTPNANISTAVINNLLVYSCSGC